MSGEARTRIAVTRIAGVALGVVLLVGCTLDEGELTEPVVETATIAPTTSLVVEFIDAAGLPYCDVARQVAPAIQVFSDSSSNYGDTDTIRDTYVEAYKAFDALSQVAAREIEEDLGVLTLTLSEAVRAAAQVEWDLTVVSDDAASGVESQDVVLALAHLRQYSRERCGLDIVGIEPPITAGPAETPEQRLFRVLGETFPVLGDEAIACVAAGLSLDFDPDDPELDQDLVTFALRKCGIDPDSPSTPTTIEETTTTG